MSTYLLAYRIPENYTFASAEVNAAWSAWFADLGADLADAGNPIYDRRTLGNCGTNSDSVLGGYSLVTAADLDSALELAKGCPVLHGGGGVEVGEVTSVSAATLGRAAQDSSSPAGLGADAQDD